jgi:prolipoprotein diacylglyceryltransferase
MLTISIDPVAFTIGSLEVRWYGIMMAHSSCLAVSCHAQGSKKAGHHA